jgi:hypothetical protein
MCKYIKTKEHQEEGRLRKVRKCWFLGKLFISYLKNPNAQQCLQTEQTKPNEVKDLHYHIVLPLVIHKTGKLHQNTRERKSVPRVYIYWKESLATNRT